MVEKMKCLKCGEELDEESNFCTNCGYKIAITKCPKCNEHLEGDELFCSNCGYKLNNNDSLNNKNIFTTNINSKGLTNKLNTKIPNPLADRKKHKDTRNIPLPLNDSQQLKNVDDSIYIKNVKLLTRNGIGGICIVVNLLNF